jgi:hypothetical protein
LVDFAKPQSGAQRDADEAVIIASVRDAFAASAYARLSLNP